MTFDIFWEKVVKFNRLIIEAEYIRDSYDDYGAIPGCECGCGGDTFDWDAQEEAFKEADRIESEANELMEEIKKAWGEQK